MSYQFQSQRANEEVVLLARPHPLVLLHPFLLSVLFLLIPLAIYIFAPVGDLLAGAIVVCLVAALIRGGLAWYAWAHTTLVLTNERLLYVEQRGFLHREVVECSLPSIQQVSHEVKGVRKTVFGYGTISLYTGGSVEAIKIKDMPEPYDIQQEIQRVAAISPGGVEVATD